MNLLSKVFPFMFLLIFCKAEAQYTFQKTFGHPNANVTDVGYDSICDSLGNIYTVGSSGYQNYGGGIVIKTDSMGNVIWKNFYGPKNSSLNEILLSNDGNLLIKGSFILPTGEKNLGILKIDTSGNLLWGKTLRIALFISKFLENSNGDIYISGANIFIDTLSIQHNMGFLMKLDLTANLIWAKHLPEQFFSDYADMLIINDSTLIFTGEIDTTGNQGGNNRHILLSALDTSGSILWSKMLVDSFIGGGSFINRIGTNGYLVTGVQVYPFPFSLNHVFIKLDNNFNIEWSRKNTNSSGGVFSSSLTDFNGDVLFSGDAPSAVKMDSLGNILWSKGYGWSGFNNFMHHIKSSENNGYIITGQLGQYFDIILIKTDSDGNTPCYTANTNPTFNSIPFFSYSYINCTLYYVDTLLSYGILDSVLIPILNDTAWCGGFSEVHEIENENKISLLKIYPNPVRDHVKVIFDQTNWKEEWKLEIFNSIGQIIKITYKYRFEDTIEINLSNIESNILIFHFISSNGQVYSTKIVKLNN